MASTQLPSDENPYLLGTHDEEIERLEFQHTAWSEKTTSLWNKAGLGPGKTLLDLGCGPGFSTLELAKRVQSHGKVLAVDASKRYLSYLQAHLKSQGLQNVSVHESTVEDLKLTKNSVDGIFARWLFCFLKDPKSLIEKMVDFLAPGGVMVIMDYYHYDGITFGPRSPALDLVKKAVMQSWKNSGGSLDVGLNLPTWLREAGLEVTHLESLSQIVRSDHVLFEWPKAFFFKYNYRLVEMGLITEQVRAQFEKEYLECAANPTGFYSTPPMMGLVAQKPR